MGGVEVRRRFQIGTGQYLNEKPKSSIKKQSRNLKGKNAPQESGKESPMHCSVDVKRVGPAPGEPD
jgi:hypothetical protein